MQFLILFMTFFNHVKNTAFLENDPLQFIKTNKSKSYEKTH